jgi:uncharacterized protein YjiS (DUF1127 family)
MLWVNKPKLSVVLATSLLALVSEFARLWGRVQFTVQICVYWGVRPYFMLARWRDAVKLYYSRRALADLDERLLDDIGVDPAAVKAELSKPFIGSPSGWADHRLRDVVNNQPRYDGAAHADQFYQGRRKVIRHRFRS